MKKPEKSPINVTLHYPYNDKFDYITQLQKINLDRERDNDLNNGRGFIITDVKSIKKDIKTQGGIFSTRYGSTSQDAESYKHRYSCNCGMLQGSINHGIICTNCDSVVRFRDDNMSIFGWIVLKEYCIIHPNIYCSLESLIGADRLDRIIEADIQVDVNGREIVNDSIPKKKDEPFRGIGLPEFQRRFQEIIDFYLSIHPTKKNYYDDIMAHKDMVFAHSIPVFSTLLRPTKLDNNGSLKYEKTNENYNLIAHLVNECNKNKLKPDRQKKNKYELLYGIQTQFNIIYDELCKILAKKKGDIRSAIGGRYAFTSRCVIRQSVHLKPDQIALPYHCLCELLQQVIINILVRSYNFSYADAYKKWYKGQLTFDPTILKIIKGLINDSNGGLPVLINRNPTINFGGILSCKVVDVNLDFTMSISLLILPLLAADFDGDTLNIMYLYNQDFIREADKILSPRQMFISKNDGRCNMQVMHSRDTIINANGLKSLCKYTDDEIAKIKRLQQMD